MNSVTLFVILATLSCGALAIEPGCRTRYEFRMKWALPNSPSGYYQCLTWGNADLRSCPIGTLFSAPYQTCVPAKHWEEFPYYAPPTSATDSEDACAEIEFPETCEELCKPVVCNGGVIVDGKCECPTQWDLVDGTCIAPPGEIDGCENGTWDAVDMRCICDEGFELVEGVCTAVPGTVGVCPGAPDEAYAPGPMSCEPPVCTEDVFNPNTHWPTRNPRSFYQCAQVDIVKEMPCGAGTCFDWAEQVCVHARDWKNWCN